MAEKDQNKNVPETLPQGKTEEAERLENGQFAPGNQVARRNYGTPHFGPIFRKALEKFVVTKDGKQITWEEAIITKALSKAANGDSKMLNIILDRVEGKPTQSIALEPIEAGQTVLTPEQEARVERLFGFKNGKPGINPAAKVQVHTLEKAPVPKPEAGKHIIPPGKLVITNPAPQVTKTIGTQTITIKKNAIQPGQPNNPGQNKAA